MTDVGSTGGPSGPAGVAGGGQGTASCWSTTGRRTSSRSRPILSSLDQSLVRATSGEEALKALLAEDFAVILLDVQMPGMDGFETASHIKRRERTRDIPIIFLTAINREPQHAFRGYSAGAVDYLAKPFDPWVLRAKVSVFVELYLKNRQLLRAGRAAARASWPTRRATRSAPT